MKTQEPRLGDLVNDLDEFSERSQAPAIAKSSKNGPSISSALEEDGDGPGNSGLIFPSTEGLSLDQIIKRAKTHPGLRRRATISHVRIFKSLHDIPENSHETEDKCLISKHFKELRRHSFNGMSLNQDEQDYSKRFDRLETGQSVFLDACGENNLHSLSVPAGTKEPLSMNRTRKSGETITTRDTDTARQTSSYDRNQADDTNVKYRTTSGQEVEHNLGTGKSEEKSPMPGQDRSALHQPCNALLAKIVSDSKFFKRHDLVSNVLRSLSPVPKLKMSGAANEKSSCNKTGNRRACGDETPSVSDVIPSNAGSKSDKQQLDCVKSDQDNIKNCSKSCEQEKAIEAPKRKISVQVMRRSPIIFSVSSNEKKGDKETKILKDTVMAGEKQGAQKSTFKESGSDSKCRINGVQDVQSTVSVSRQMRSAFGTFQGFKSGKTSENASKSTLCKDATPTGKRFAALSERYASLQVKFAQGFGKEKRDRRSDGQPEDKSRATDDKKDVNSELNGNSCNSKEDSTLSNKSNSSSNQNKDTESKKGDKCSHHGNDRSRNNNKYPSIMDNNNNDQHTDNIYQSDNAKKGSIQDVDSNADLMKSNVKKTNNTSNEQNSLPLNSSTSSSTEKGPRLEKVWTTVESLMARPLNTKENQSSPAATEIGVKTAMDKLSPVQAIEDATTDPVQKQTRTSVLAKLMDRKLTRRRKQSIVPKAVQRKSKVYKTVQAGGVDIPTSLAEFEAIRSQVEKTVRIGSLRSEALTIRVLLTGLNATLAERELVAVCKECTKTLRTLDALGSLPSYLSLDTVIINPSGTIKFKHLNTGVSIDNFFLAPDHNKKFSSEKTCVFSLAATIWSAADWHLTEAQKPSLSANFRELLVSMTDDDPAVRIGLDEVLQICEEYQSQGDMTSRERCQALLWEYQVALATENEQALMNKALGEQKQARSQHDKLMGSISVAASVKGFLKETAKPQERSHPLKTQNEKLQKGPQTSARVQNEGKNQPRKPSTLKTVGEKPMDSRKETSPTKLATHEVENNTGKLAGSSEQPANKTSNHVQSPDSANSAPLGEKKEAVSPGGVLQQQGLSLTAEQKEQLMSLLMSDKMQSSKSCDSQKPMTRTLDSQPVKDNQEHVTKPPTPPVDVLIHPETQRLFTPIAPAGSPQGVDGSRSSQVSTPTLISVPIAMSAVNASPVASMWYMPAGVIPYGRPGSPYTQFVPIDPSVTCSQESERDSDVNECADGEHKIANDSTPKAAQGVHANHEKEPKRTRRFSQTPSKIPRPTWRNEMDSGPISRGRSVSEGNAVMPRARTPPPSLGRRPAPESNPPRAKTPPVHWTRSGVDIGRQGGQRPLRKSTGSMPSLRQSRPPSPQSRPGSPCSRRTSGEFSPISSRSSSPVSLLVCKYEEMSKTPEEDAPRGHSKSVSSLLSKFGSSSLVPEDRMTKGQFKPNVSPSSGQTSSRAGPLKPASASEGEIFIDPDNSHVGGASTSTDNLGKTRDVQRTGSGPARIRMQDSGESLSSENMERLSASLEALFRGSDSNNSPLYESDAPVLSSVNSERKWLSPSERVDFTSEDRESIDGFTNEYTKEVRAPTVISTPGHLNGGIIPRQELLETEPVRESVRPKSKPNNLVLTPEKDITLSRSSHPIPSPNGMFEIPVNEAIMDSIHSENSTPMISPLSPSPGHARNTFFSSGTLVSERNVHVRASALSPRSLKDYKPTNFFKNSPLKSSMEPERDINPVPSQIEDVLQRTTETQVKPPSPGKNTTSPGSKEQEYVKRFEKRVSKSGQDEKVPDARDAKNTHNPLDDGKSTSGLANAPSPENTYLKPLYRSGSGKRSPRRSPTPTGRDFVAYSSPMLTAKSPRNPTLATYEPPTGTMPPSSVMTAKRNSLPQTSSDIYSSNSGKDGSDLRGRRKLLSQSNPSIPTKATISKTRSSPLGPVGDISAGQTNAKERSNPHAGKRHSAGGSSNSSLSDSRDRDPDRGNVGNVGQDGDDGSSLDLHQGRKPNLSFPHNSCNTRTTKKHPSAPTTPTTKEQNKIPDLAFMRRQSTPAASTLGLPKNYTHKVKTSSNPATPNSESSSNFPLFSSGSRPPSSNSLAHATFPGSPRHSWMGSEGSVTSEGSSNNPSSPEILKNRGSYSTKEKYSTGSSTSSSPLTSPPGSFSKSLGSGPLSPTRAQVFDYSHKRGSMDSEIFFNPKDIGLPGTGKRNTRVPSSSSSDSGINQSETDDSKSSTGFIRSETQSPISPKFPTSQRIFYEPGGDRANEKGKKAEILQTKRANRSNEDLSTAERRRRSSEAQQETHRPPKARHSSSPGEETVKLLTKKSSSGSSRDSVNFYNLGDRDSGKSSGKTRQGSSSSSDRDGSKRSPKSPISPHDQSLRPDSVTALSKRPPSPGRIDSKELLGQLVKKVLTSAAAKQGTSPTSSFSDNSTTPAKDRDKCSTSPQGEVLNPLVEKLGARPEESKTRSKSTTPRKQSLDKDAVGGRRKSSTGSGKHPSRTEPSAVPNRSKEPSIICSNASTVEGSPTEVSTSDEGTILSKLIDMIHDEFAFDGYLDDGVEDVNMAEYVLSLAGMSEDNFKEAITDQYIDLYWDEDLLHDMFEAVTGDLHPKKPTLQFSESSVSDFSMPESATLSRETSSLGTDSLYLNSISRSSSERSATESRDILMSSMGEPTEFLPIKIIAPEIIRDIQEELTPIFEDYHKEMNVKLSSSIEELTDKLGTKVLEISQQLLLERRAKKKNINSFNKLVDMENKKDAKDLASKFLKEIEESDRKIIYLKNVQRRLRNVYCERFGLDHSLLHSFVNSYKKDCLTLETQRSNDFLNFSPSWDHRSAAGSDLLGESSRGPNLQYGTQKGLFSYLFGRYAMSQAFVRYFLYTFRYCATAKDLFAFIRDKCAASLRVDSAGQVVFNHQLQIRYRALDLLAEWIDGYYFYDFKNNLDLVKELLVFVRDELILVDRSERGNYLVELISEKQKQDQERQANDNLDTVAVLQMEDTQGFSVIDNPKDSPRKHLGGRRKSKSPVQCFRRGTPEESGGYKATLYLKAMSVTDHSYRTLAEHLTLVQQDIFTRAHPIHFLNSRALGIGVGRTQSPNKERESIFGFSAGSRRASEFAGSEQTSSLPQNTDGAHLFVGELNSDGCLEELLEHAQDVSMWVAVEICSASSTKSQLALITKFVSIARYCCEMRNFATCVQIVDALEMFVVRQLPVWKHIPNKTNESLEELKVVKVILKTDSQWLLKDGACRVKPTLPCILLFLMHIQQQEIGGFTLANGMYKWAKMRSISRLIDQIRLFKQMRYAFEADKELKDRLKQRLLECKKENLHALASENTSNFHSNSSHGSRKFQNTLKKMKATFGQG